MQGSWSRNSETAISIKNLTKFYQKFQALDDVSLPELVRSFFLHLARGAGAELERVDAILKRHVANWEIQRMAAIDRNILRIAAFEILTDVDTPVSVIIDEAIEIAKIFSTSDSGKFVNGVLDKVKSERP